jgi:tetratricopeptide (TPR) repeat protein
LLAQARQTVLKSTSWLVLPLSFMPTNSRTANPAPHPKPTGETLSREARDALLYRSALAYQTGDIVSAERECRELLRQTPTFAPALLLAGMIAAKRGDWNAALSSLGEAAARDPRLAQAHSELGMVLREVGRHEQAIARFKQALRLNGKDSGTYNNLGLTYLAMAQFARAEGCFRRAIALNPKLASLHFNLGTALRGLGFSSEAVEAYRKAVELAPYAAEPLIALGDLLIRSGDKQDGEVCFRRAVAATTDTARRELQLAQLLIDAGCVVEAEVHLRNSLAADAGFAQAHRSLASVLTQMGLLDDAVASYERAVALEPDNTAGYVGLTWARRISEPDRPLVNAMQALLARVDPLDADAGRLHYALGKSMEDLGAFEAAMSHFDAANAIAFRLLGDRALDHKRLVASIDRTIAGFTPTLFARHRAHGAEDETPVLIVGLPRSGTTLVEQIVSSHPDVVAGGELAFWGERGPLLGDVARGVEKPELRRLIKEYRELLQRIAPGARRVTDKRPHNFLMLGTFHLAFPRGCVIHCRRHPVDTCLSIYTTPFQGAPDYAHDKDNIVFYYEQYARLMAHWRRVLPPTTMLEIEYEALVEDFETVSRRIIAFLGLDWDQRCLRPEANPRIVQTPSAWQVRKPINVRSVARWRRFAGQLGAFSKLLPEG